MNIQHINYLLNYATIEIKNCSQANKSGSWIESSSNSNYDLWIITNGNIHIAVDEISYQLRPGDIFLLYPNMLYTANAISEKVELIFIHFDFVIGNNPKALDNFPFAGYVPDNAIELKFNIFLKAFNNYSLNSPISSFELKGQFIVLLSQIFRYRLTNPLSYLPAKNIYTNIARIHDVLNYISINTDKKILNSTLADIAQMSEKYFITYFKKTIGMTPAKYIAKEKMKKAVYLLNEKKHSIKEISQKLGYCNQYAFSKAFTKIYNKPPSKIF